jgi:hypothetical protein
MATRKPRRVELGLSLDDYERLLAAQGGGCALCGRKPKTRRLDVDHDHRTGKIRGLLCQRCNRAVPSERYLPATWTLEEWADAVSWYSRHSPETGFRYDVVAALDEINRTREDAANG